MPKTKTPAKAAKKAAKPKVAANPKPKRESRLTSCGCGCGLMVPKTYAPGHDAKHKSILVSELRSEDTSSARKADITAFLKEKGWYREGIEVKPKGKTKKVKEEQTA